MYGFKPFGSFRTTFMSKQLILEDFERRFENEKRKIELDMENENKNAKKFGRKPNLFYLP